MLIAMCHDIEAFARTWDFKVLCELMKLIISHHKRVLAGRIPFAQPSQADLV
jgi:hypothetical protein